MRSNQSLPVIADGSTPVHGFVTPGSTPAADEIFVHVSSHRRPSEADDLDTPSLAASQDNHFSRRNSTADHPVPLESSVVLQHMLHKIEDHRHQQTSAITDGRHAQPFEAARPHNFPEQVTDVAKGGGQGGRRRSSLVINEMVDGLRPVASAVIDKMVTDLKNGTGNSIEMTKNNEMEAIVEGPTCDSSVQSHVGALPSPLVGADEKPAQQQGTFAEVLNEWGQRDDVGLHKAGRPLDWAPRPMPRADTGIAHDGNDDEWAGYSALPTSANDPSPSESALASSQSAGVSAPDSQDSKNSDVMEPPVSNCAPVTKEPRSRQVSSKASPNATTQTRRRGSTHASPHAVQGKQKSSNAAAEKAGIKLQRKNAPRAKQVGMSGLGEDTKTEQGSLGSSGESSQGLKEKEFQRTLSSVFKNWGGDGFAAAILPGWKETPMVSIDPTINPESKTRVISQMFS